MNEVKAVGLTIAELSEIPKDWRIEKLGDLFLDIRTGSTPSRSVPQYFTGTIPWITSGELKYKVINDTKEKITKQAVKDTNLRIYPKGTFFIAITGLEAEGTRGSCGIAGVEATTNQSCLAFEPIEGLSNLYLYYWYRLYGDQIATRYAQGTKQQSLNHKIVKEIQIAVPPIEEQKEITAILSSVDYSIEKTEAIIEQTDKMKKGLMKQLLTKGIGHTKFNETQIGEIPEEWDVKQLGEVAKRISVGYVGSINKFYTDTNGVLLLRTGNISKKGIKLADVKYVTRDFHDKNKKSQLNPGDIIISRHGDSGTATIIPSYISESNCLNVVVVKKSNDMNSHFICYLFNSGIVKNLLNKTKAGSVQGVINTKEIQNVSIPFPSLSEQSEIVNILTTIDKKLLNEERKLNKLIDIKKALMQVLLTGKVRVKVGGKEVTTS